MKKLILSLSMVLAAPAAFATSYTGQLKEGRFSKVPAVLKVQIQGNQARLAVQSSQASCVPQFTTAVSNGNLNFGGLLTPAKARFYYYQARETKCYKQVVGLSVYTDQSGNPTGYVAITGRFGRGTQVFFAN